MESITINNLMGCEHISIPAAFIDNYISASGDCIKVYLYLLRILNSKDASLVLSDMADKLDMTPNNVKRALKYWENAGIMRCVFSGSTIKSTLKEITFLPIPDVCENADEDVDEDIDDIVASDDDFDDLSVTVETDNTEIDDIKVESAPVKVEVSDCERLACQRIIEGTLGQLNAINAEDVDTFIIDELGYSYEMIEQLVEYCDYLKKNAEGEKKISYAYIRKVAMNWHEQGLYTAADIKNYINSAKLEDAYKLVRDYLALDALSTPEKAMIDNWVVAMSFGSKIITYACTKARKQRKGVERADYLLNFWNDNNLRDVKAIEDYEEKHWKDKEKKETSNRTSTKTNSKFDRFEQRKTDYANRKLEYKL